MIVEIENIYKKYDNAEKIVKKISETEVNKLSDDRKKLLVKSLKEKAEFKNRIEIYKEQLTLILPLFTKRFA